MNQELVKDVALTIDYTSMRGYMLEDRAEEAIKVTGEHLLKELAGFESGCEIRNRIAKECGLS